jgi:hypothetical protein
MADEAPSASSGQPQRPVQCKIVLLGEAFKAFQAR